jgi:hypothetical protein
LRATRGGAAETCPTTGTAASREIADTSQRSIPSLFEHLRNRAYSG